MTVKSDTYQHLMRQIQQQLSPLIIESDLSPDSHNKSKRLIARLAWRIFNRLCDDQPLRNEFANIDPKTFNWKRFQKSLISTFLNALQHVEYPQDNKAEKIELAIENVVNLLSNYPYCQFTEHNFYYFNNDQPSFLLLTDQNGYPVALDLAPDLQDPQRFLATLSTHGSNGYLAKDVEGALDGINEHCRYLIEVNLPLNCQINWWQDHAPGETVNAADFGIYRYRGLRISHYREEERYDLHKLTDIKKLKLRGLFKEFPDTWSDNKLSLATWHEALTAKDDNPTDYDKKALWFLLGITEIPKVRFKPRNPSHLT